MGISEEDVLLSLEAATAYSTLSLDVPMGPEADARALGDLIPEDDDTLSTFVDMEAVKPLIDRLPPRDKSILLLRFYGKYESNGDRCGVRPIAHARLPHPEEGPRPAQGGTPSPLTSS